MKYILAVFILGLLSLAAQTAESWVLYGWLHYCCGSIITYFLIDDYHKHKCEDNDE